ncbi:MAG: glycosyltransferase family 10 [Kiritimatiellae bacterium]|nr:glycosyltransferase family 10 [Kiritimatiellia bacterium]
MTNLKPIRVKIIANGRNATAWARQTPQNAARWGGCQFLLNLNEREYDWLVVIDDISKKLKSPPEILPCPQRNTILVTSEPATITRYGKGFAAQFGTLLTSQEKKFLPHPNRIHSQTGNLWFHGKSYDELQAEPPIHKTALISTVCSSKKQAHTMHSLRYNFTQRLKTELPELEIYGHGVRYIEEKHEALSPYQFHLAIENHVAPHHWTEKLSDPLLAYCVPIYSGCPNAAEYFSPESFVQIDITDPECSVATIKRVLASAGEYERRLDAVKASRQKVLREYNLLAMLDQIISDSQPDPHAQPGGIIYNRRQMRSRSFSDLATFLCWRLRNSLRR